MKSGKTCRQTKSLLPVVIMCGSHRENCGCPELHPSCPRCCDRQLLWYVAGGDPRRARHHHGRRVPRGGDGRQRGPRPALCHGRHRWLQNISDEAMFQNPEWVDCRCIKSTSQALTQSEGSRLITLDMNYIVCYVTFVCVCVSWMKTAFMKITHWSHFPW